ncbi:MAG TPA: DUF397 domain-containing protein [Streptosporangiaceae bacterium]|jgi:hypothetical protein|nr:DUF397 domain-containing protein [Streptosporangiaceae bacterium]
MDTSHVTWRKASYSSNGANCVEVGVWRKASYSNNGADCVEVGASVGADEGALCLVRDTKDRGGPSLAFTAGQWAAFTADVKAGAFGRTA